MNKAETHSSQSNISLSDTHAQFDEHPYKILIVDDEEPIRIGLKYSIDWKSMGFRAADTAADVETAIELYNYNTYDVIITDINMPEKNGFNLIQSLKEKKPNIKTVVISGYDYFEYAVEAIRLGADDYILKPIKKKNIESTFVNLKKKLDKERNANLFNNISKQIAKSYFLTHLVQNDYASKDIILSTIQKFEIDLPNSEMCVITICFDNLPKFINEFFFGTVEAIELMIKDNIAKHFPESSKEVLTTFIGNHYIMLVNGCETHFFITAFAKFLDKINYNYKVGVGKKAKSIDYIPVSYRESIEALQKNTVSKINFYKNENSSNVEYSRLLLFHKKIIDRMESGRFEEISRLVDDMFSLLSNSDINLMYNWAINSIHEILEYFYISKQQKVTLAYQMNFSKSTDNDLCSEVKASYLEHLNRIKDMLKSFSSTPNQELVKKACEIVENDFANKNLTLYNVANRLNISYGYLCTIFKQITGSNFTDYLISVRMKNARKMILENKHKMFEIAYLTGYETARYFALVFRKYYGVAPSDYKKRLGGDE